MKRARASLRHRSSRSTPQSHRAVRRPQAATKINRSCTGDRFTWVRTGHILAEDVTREPGRGFLASRPTEPQPPLRGAACRRSVTASACVGDGSRMFTRDGGAAVRTRWRALYGRILRSLRRHLPSRDELSAVRQRPRRVAASSGTLRSALEPDLRTRLVLVALLTATVKPCHNSIRVLH
jgi:hypothetical protein